MSSGRWKSCLPKRMFSYCEIISGLIPFSSMKKSINIEKHTNTSTPLDEFSHLCSQYPAQGTPQEWPSGLLSVTPHPRMGFSGGLDGKESTCNAGDLGLEDPWRREWLLIPVFLPDNPMDGGAWQATVSA